MGKRKGMALTEVQYIGIKNLILSNPNKEMRNKLFFFYEIMIKTGIRRSEWNALAAGWHKNKTQMYEIMIPKQSRTNKSKDDGTPKAPVLVKRLVKLPENVYIALNEGIYDFPIREHDWVRQKTDQIKALIKGTDYDRPLSPHDFRHTFAIFAKHRGWDIYDVKSVTKHASLASLEKYFEEDTDIIEAVYDSMAKDYYDLSQPSLLMKENNKLKLKIKHLEAKLAIYEKGSE